MCTRHLRNRWGRGEGPPTRSQALGLLHDAEKRAHVRRRPHRGAAQRLRSLGEHRAAWRHNRIIAAVVNAAVASAENDDAGRGSPGASVSTNRGGGCGDTERFVVRGPSDPGAVSERTHDMMRMSGEPAPTPSLRKTCNSGRKRRGVCLSKTHLPQTLADQCSPKRSKGDVNALAGVLDRCRPNATYKALRASERKELLDPTRASL